MATFAPPAGPHPKPTGRSGGMFSSTFTLGRIAGIPIGVNWTWLAVFALFVWSLAAQQFPSSLPVRSVATYAAMGIAAAVLFFGSLILHEIGHALQAGREGVRIEGITLWLFGGVAKIKDDFPSAGAELRIAVAGPLVTLVLAGAFALGAIGGPSSGAVHEVLLWLSVVNLTLLVFNLVPAMPLDGGRMLRAILWARSGDRPSATHRATRIGTMLATIMIVLGVLEAFAGGLAGIWLAVIGWFILEAGRAEEQHVLVHDRLAGVATAALMTRAPVTVEPDVSLADVVAAISGTSRHTAYPVVINGDVIGLLQLDAMTHHPPQEWPRLSVRQCMIPADRVVALTPGTPASAALDELVQHGAGRAVVLDGGELIGILSVTDLARALASDQPV